MELRLNNEANLTLRFLEEVSQHPKSFNLTEKDIAEKKKKIESGKNVRFVDPSEIDHREHFEIIDDDKMLGHITTDFDRNGLFKVWEIDIIIYSEYRRNKLAQQAIQLLMANNPDRYWEAGVYKSNPCHPFVTKILRKCGFRHTTDRGELEEWESLNFIEAREEFIRRRYPAS